MDPLRVSFVSVIFYERLTFNFEPSRPFRTTISHINLSVPVKGRTIVTYLHSNLAFDFFTMAAINRSGSPGSVASNHEFRRIGSRSPCPALNILANHGYM